MKLAVVVGGWHWPFDLFRKFADCANGADLYVVSHRSPELPIVRDEKREILGRAIGPLADLDRQLYAEFPTIDRLRKMGWHYLEAPNEIGDWGFFNQWLAVYDYRRYDVILNCHDDTFIRRPDVMKCLNGDWLLLSNGRYPEAPTAYVRGSFEFWKRGLLDMLGGRIDLGDVRLTREGQTDSPEGLAALSAWNDTAVPLRNWIVQRGLANKVDYLSQHYRISPWIIEAERGFLHLQGGAPWSFEAGLKAYPVEGRA